MTIEKSESVIEQPIVESLESEAIADNDDDMQEPVYNRVDMQKVVNREKQKAFERGKREALMELQQQQAQDSQVPNAPPAMQQPQAAPQSLGGVQQLGQADIERLIAEQAPQALQAHVQQIKRDQMVQSFVSKMEQAEQKYPGLEAELNKLNYQDVRLHSFIEMANNLDNTGDIMKEVLDNPSKMESLLNMAANQPYQAQKALQSLSDSIKLNQDALAQETQARDPLSQLKPSANTGMVDSNALSVRDLRKMLSRK